MHVQPFLQWLLLTSWQAGVLVCLIVLAQRVLGRWMGVRGRYWLWAVLLLRMAMPWAPPSSVSVHNLLFTPLPEGYGWAATPESGSVGSGLAAPSGASATGGHSKAGPTAGDRPAIEATTSPAFRARHWLEGRAAVLLLFWLAGVCTLIGYIIAGYVRLWRVVRRESPVTDPRILDLLNDCRRQIGVKRVVDVIATDRIGGAAMFGFLRPRLLLPRETLAQLSLQELRHIFLHELAHLKRHDIFTGCIVTALHVLHWFNPLIGLGLKRMRADRELACDALALSVLTPDETIAYGHTIVHQIERLLTSRPRWVPAGLSGDRARIKERIAMIARFRRDTHRDSLLTVMLMALLAFAGLTDRLTAGTPWDDDPARSLPTTHQDKHANIIRVHIRNRETGEYLAVERGKLVCNATKPGTAGLWEARFDEDLGNPDQIVFFYSAAARKYLTSDGQGNLAIDAPDPGESAQWSVVARPGGNWIISRAFKDGYLRLSEEGHVSAVNFGRDILGCWDIDQLWRVKTSDNPKSNPDWRRQHVPGSDWGPPWSLQGRSK